MKELKLCLILFIFISCNSNPEKSKEFSQRDSTKNVHHKAYIDTSNAEGNLLDEIDRQLAKVKNHQVREPATKIIYTAKKLSEHSVQEGYEKIKTYLLNMNWDSESNREFYTLIYDYTYHRADFTEVFFEGLKKAPAPSEALNNSCSAFRENRRFKKFRFEPKYTYGLLLALARIEKSGNLDDFFSTYDTCKESFRQHLLKPELRRKFIEIYRNRLNNVEGQILDRFLEVIAAPDKDIPSIMYSSFLKVEWHQSYKEWRDKHPGAKCKKNHGDTLIDFEELDKLWAYRCQLPEERFRMQYYFYPGRNAKANRLQKIRFSYPITEVDVIKPLSGLLERDLGKAQKVGSVHDYGSAAWSRIHSWQTENFRLLLFNNSRPADWWHSLPQVEMYARSQDLKSWIEAVQPRTFEGSLSKLAEQERNRVFKVLEPNLPEIKKKWDQLDSADVVLDIIHGLIDYTALNEELRAAKLYLADLLVDRLAEIGEEAGQLERWENNLSEYDIRFTMHYYSNTHNHSFKAQILEEELNGFWADETAVWALQSAGAYFGTDDKDLFKKVIPFAKTYLEKHPDSQKKDDLLYYLARAHETAWALSTAYEGDPTVNPEKYKEDAERHRKKSVSYYEKLIQMGSDNLNMEIVKIRWRWVKLNVPTNSRHYYIYTLG